MSKRFCGLLALTVVLVLPALLSQNAAAAKPLKVKLDARALDPGMSVRVVKPKLNANCSVRLERKRGKPRVIARASGPELVVPAGAAAGPHTVRVRCGGRTGKAGVRVHDPLGPDFNIELRQTRQPSGRRILEVRVRNVAPWTATSMRACLQIRSGGRVIGARGTSVTRSTTGACRVMPRLGGGDRTSFAVRVKDRPGPLEVVVQATAGNSTKVERAWSVRAKVRPIASPATGARAGARRAQAAPAVCATTDRVGVVFVADDSGSMSDTDPDVLRGRAIDVGLDQLPDGTVVAGTRFSDQASELFGVAALDAPTRSRLKGQSGEFFATGGTDYDAAFTAAKAQLDAITGVQRKAVVFLSDGQPNDDGFTADQAIAAAGVPIFTVGFGDADEGTLAKIAAASGGQTFAATDASDLQSIFARITAVVTCAAAKVTTKVDLDPGATAEVPWSVGANDGEFRALAAWVGEKVTVTAVRPDGTELTPTQLRNGESFSDNPTYALVAGVAPAIGGWKLRLTAPSSNLSRVNVSIDVFQKGLPPLPPLPPLDLHTQGRAVDPCVAMYPGGRMTDKKIFGSTETNYDRAMSGYLVCMGFGAPEDIEFSVGMKCAMISAAIAFGGGAGLGPEITQLDQFCGAASTLDSLANGDYAGAVASKACDYFGTVFSTGVALVAAGATSPSGPGAVAVGTWTFRAFSAGLKVACGGLFDGGAATLGAKLESWHEGHVAGDILAKGKCLRYTSRYNAFYVKWSAETCRS